MRKLFTVDYYLPIYPFVNKNFCHNLWISLIQMLLQIAATWGMFGCKAIPW